MALEEDTLPVREGVLSVRYLSNGMGYGAPVVVADSGQNLETHQTEEGLQGIYQMLQKSRNYSFYFISSSGFMLCYVCTTSIPPYI